MEKLWTIWKYSLGSFSDDKTQEYDNYIALLRTVIFLSYMITNIAIVANATRHWNNVNYEPDQEVQCSVSTTQG